MRPDTLFLGLLTVFSSNAQAPHPGISTSRLDLIDVSRHRSVSVLLYEQPSQSALRRLVVLSHGYGGKNSDYSFIAEGLARKGYSVASIQHEVPGDEPLPTTGKPADVRRPSWQRGADNIRFVIRHLKANRPEIDASQVVLIGHSHGGDTSILLAAEHPEGIGAVISLDSRRMAFPRISKPRLFSIRSSDQIADEGVLPTAEEQAKFGITIVKLPATIHNDMSDVATEVQKAEMLRHITAFLEINKR